MSWIKTDIGNVCKLSSGNSINAKTKEIFKSTPKGINYVATKDIDYSDKINYENGVKIPFSLISNYRIAKKGSVLICAEGGSAGRKMGLLEEDVCYVNKLYCLEPYDRIISKYLYYWMKSKEFQDQFKLNLTGLIGGVSKSKFKNINVLIPSVSEQKQIVETLDKAFEKIDKAIANVERNIKNGEELFQSKLNSYFLDETNYKEVKIIETCDDKSQIVGGPFGSNLKVKDYIDSGIPILRLQNIGKGYFINKSIKYISHKKAEELKYHSFKKGDIVLAKLGIPIGKTCIVPESFENGIVVADVVRIRPNVDLVNYSFLKNFLNSDSAVNQLSSEIRGSTRPRVNISEVRNLKLRLPPLNIQLKINQEIEELYDLKTKQINTYNKMLESLDELKKSILEKAFKGELTSAA